MFFVSSKCGRLVWRVGHIVGGNAVVDAPSTAAASRASRDRPQDYHASSARTDRLPAVQHHAFEHFDADPGASASKSLIVARACSACRTTGRAATSTPACARAASPAGAASAEVRERHDRLAADAHHLAQHRSAFCRSSAASATGCTMSKLSSSKSAGPFEVLLDHVDAVLHAGQHARRRSRCRSRCTSRSSPSSASSAPSPQPRSSTRERGSHPARDRREVGAQRVSRKFDACSGSCADLVRNALVIGAHHVVVARVVEQERVVAVRRVDLGVADVAPVVDQRLDDLARARRREAPVGGEADDAGTCARRRRKRRASGRRRCARAGSK